MASRVWAGQVMVRSRLRGWLVGYWPLWAAVAVAGAAVGVGRGLLPTDREAADALGDSSLAPKAIAYRLRDARSHPDRPELLLPLAESYVLAGDQAQALDVLDQFLAERPRDLAALRRAATLADWQVEPDRAAAYRQRIREGDPREAEVREWLADYLLWKQRTAEAIAVYLELLALNPSDLEQLLRAGDVLSWNDRLPEAIAVFKRAVESHPRAIEAHIRLGRSLRWDSQDKAATEAFEALARLDPDNPVAWTQLADLYRLTDRPEDRARAQAELARLASKG